MAEFQCCSTPIYSKNANTSDRLQLSIAKATGFPQQGEL